MAMPAATTATPATAAGGPPAPPPPPAGPRREAPPAPDPRALPDRLVQRRLARRDGLERLVEPSGQVLLVADVHCCPPSTSSVLVRSAARAREAWLFTVPTEQPSVTAVSVSVSPTQ